MNAVGDLEHLRHVVRDEDDRHALVAQALNELEDLSGLSHPERGGRLVENDHLAAKCGGAGDRHRLALATRQGLDGLAHVL